MLWIIIGICRKSNAHLNLVSSVEKQKYNYIFDVALLTLKKRRTYSSQIIDEEGANSLYNKNGKVVLQLLPERQQIQRKIKPAGRKEAAEQVAAETTQCCPKKDSTQTTGSPGSKTSKSRCDVRFRIHRGQFIFSSFTFICGFILFGMLCYTQRSTDQIQRGFGPHLAARRQIAVCFRKLTRITELSGSRAQLIKLRLSEDSKYFITGWAVRFAQRMRLAPINVTRCFVGMVMSSRVNIELYFFESFG
ncbi:Hypothetical_protein [Hexamita inflata]|uniref:Hypothetical_protein n=1 Tax=Hexamita inflata TaxID=28002 RepID=A0AA86TT61_9EUKA|nr:Hypothetical protein HINF_LOCUS13502 [Hexamita inflata]